MYYELIINKNKNVSTNLKEKEEYNKNEVITVFHSMIQANASTKYPMYQLYEESFYKFATDITKISKIINHKDDNNVPEPVYMEEDKKILVKPKTKTTSITEMFHKINKTNEMNNEINLFE
jgi:hypothetical protein